MQYYSAKIKHINQSPETEKHSRLQRCEIFFCAAEGGKGQTMEGYMKKRLILAIVTVILWSTQSAVTKILLTDIPNFQFLCMSSFLAFLFLLSVNLFTGKKKEMRGLSATGLAKMPVLGIIGIFLYSVLYYYGISRLTAQTACILNYLWPVMLTLFSAVLLKEKLTAVRPAASALSFSGAAVVIFRGNGHVSFSDNVPGYIACILAAVCYGLFSALNKKYHQE